MTAERAPATLRCQPYADGQDEPAPAE
eukprot:COSAG01_NODE_36730_length_513_cov_0.995169_1_plen_26_part_01